MRTIIAGSRHINGLRHVQEVVKESGFKITTIIEGGCRGVDAAARHYAHINQIPAITYPADWHRHGKAAGPIRNREMAETADALIAIWDGESKGTHDMIKIARKLGLKVFVKEV